jgi:hypothetical protein
MAGNIRIVDRKDGHAASVVQHPDQPQGLVVYTDPLLNYSYDVQYLLSEQNGREMAITPSTLGTTLGIHNGGDNTYWTPSQISGSAVDFASATQVYAGAAAIDATGVANNDVFQFAPASPINLSSYSFLRFYIYIEDFSTRGTDKDILFYFMSNGVEVGNQLSIKLYADSTSFNNWLQVDVPTGDFQITAATVDALRFKTVDLGSGAAPSFHLDDIQLINAGANTGAEDFVWQPPYGEKYSLTGLRFTAITSGKTELDSSEFFGITALSNGIELVYRNRTQVFKALDAKDLFDLLSWGNVKTTAFGATNNVTIICEFEIPQGHFVLDGSDLQRILVRVRDDLSGIDRLNCSLTLTRITQDYID